MSSRIYPTGNVYDPVPLIEKSRALCPGVRFHSSNLVVMHHHWTEYVLALKVALAADRA